MDKLSVGNRMKRYELSSKQYLTQRIPAILRIDGRSFHTYTKGFRRPFDDRIICTMAKAAAITAKGMQGFKVGYVQSDEASFLLTDYDNLETKGWFDYNMQKLCSISASVMTAHFNRIISKILSSEEKEIREEWGKDPRTEREDFEQEVEKLDKIKNKIAYFDARVFSIPKEDVANYFKWRQIDWFRNSLSMYCGEFYSSKEMHGKKKDDQHEMLYKKGKNWATDLNSQKKNGTFLYEKDKELVKDSDYIVEYDSFYQKFEGIN